MISRLLAIQEDKKGMIHLGPSTIGPLRRQLYTIEFVATKISPYLVVSYGNDFSYSRFCQVSSLNISQMIILVHYCKPIVQLAFVTTSDR